MWNYSLSNQGRQFGKAGVAGQYTPLATKFLQFQAQYGEKLFREIYDAMTARQPGESQRAFETRRKEARRYLVSHLSAMVALAGTLGMPAVTAVASIYDRIVDSLFADDDEEPTNIRVAYRNWLAGMLGQEAAEIVAHGGFRALDIDISTRIGQQDLIPFSRFLEDRREMKEAVPDLARRLLGAPFGLGENLVRGGEALMDGDIMEGMIRMLPNGFAGPAKAIRLSEKGFVNADGQELPISDPGAHEVLGQFFGFNPARNAEYSSARGAQAVRRSLLMRDARVLRNGIISALEEGDQDTARDLIRQASEFERANPTFPVLRSLSETIRRRQWEAAVALATDMPLGVNPRDLGARALTSYANY